MAILRYVLAIGLAALPAGCSPSRPAGLEMEESTSVYSMLHAGSDLAAVLLLRYDPGAAEPFQRLSGAGVQIGSAHGLTELEEAPTGFPDCTRTPGAMLPSPTVRSGCYAARLADEIRPGQRYDLRVELPGGDSITGTVTVPEAPVLLSPAARTRVVVPAPGQVVTSPSSEFTVRWKGRQDAARVEVGVGGATAYRQGRRLTDVACLVNAGSMAEDPTRADSLRYGVLSADCTRGHEPVQWDSISLRVVVTAYDSAYARYAKEVLPNSSVRSDRASAGVVGAYGVFAGAASGERLVVLVPTR